MLENLKNLVNDWLIKIQRSNDDELLKEIKVLKQSSKDWYDAYIKRQLELDELNIKYQFLLTHNEKPEIAKPSWLSDNMIYKPKRRFVSKTLDVTLNFEKPQHCFDKSTLLYELLKENNLLNVEKTYDNMKKIMQLITSILTYEHDKTDNWRPITDILMFLKDDCDGAALAITSALGMAGWNEDEVFTATGWYYRKSKLTEPEDRGGHAWGVAKCDGKWYVLEGTSKTAVPRLWKDWSDRYECSWGMTNWKFQGTINTGKHYLEDE